MVKKWLEIMRSSLFLKNSFVLFLGVMATNFFNYIFHFAIGRMVTPSVYGEMEMIVSLLAIVSVPGSAIALIASRYAANAKAKNDPGLSKEIFHWLNGKIIRYGLPVFAISLLSTPWVASFLKVEHEIAIIFLWAMMFLSFFSSVSIGILSGWQSFSWVGIINSVGSFFKLILGVFFVWMGFAVNGIIGSFLLSSLIGYICTLWVFQKIQKNNKEQHKEKESFSAKELTSIKPYAIRVFFASLALALLGNIDMISAKYHLDSNVVGTYGALFIVSRIIFFVSGILISVMFSMSSEEHDKKALGINKGQSKIFFHTAFLIGIFCTGSLIFFFLFPEFVMKVFFGNTYIHAANYLIWFGVVAALYTFVNLFIQYFLSIKETRVVRWLLFISLLEIPCIFFFGYDILSIVMISGFAQVLVIGVALIFFLRGKNFLKR
ncbi:MAG: oligosaccharide flippase family protein [Candidatus Moraniibacteriota bacterium]|nr:MAG: oligosaccharide flippase family protein [Candidatus Moranbacteria bacterium]